MKVALLDARDVFMRMVELPDGQAPGPRHVASITECDLPPGRYKWVPDAANRFGGAFIPLRSIEQKEQDQRDLQAQAERAVIRTTGRPGRRRT